MPCPSTYRAKIILDRPDHFGQVHIRLFWTSFYNLDLSKMIWIRPKQIGPVQINWYPTKMFWTVQNHFGSIGGQGIHKYTQYGFISNDVIFFSELRYSLVVSSPFYLKLLKILSNFHCKQPYTDSPPHQLKNWSIATFELNDLLTMFLWDKHEQKIASF